MGSLHDNEKSSKMEVDFMAYSEVEIRNQVESLSKNLPVLFTNKKSGVEYSSEWISCNLLKIE